MRFDLSPMISVPLTLRHPANMRRDYAARAHATNRARQRRQVAWAVFSAVALVWFWDLSVRLDHAAAARLEARASTAQGGSNREGAIAPHSLFTNHHSVVLKTH